MNTKLKWAASIAVIVVVLTVFMLSIPGVVEAVQRLLGYIPGSGLVDSSGPIRVLEAPASQTRTGVTMTVEEALLTVEGTRVKFSVFNVPAEAYPQREDVTGCLERPYFLLPDGSQLAEDAPIPAGVDQAVFVVPCIAHTLPDGAPEDWRFELRFVPAPPDMTVMPVVDLPPTQTPQPPSTPLRGATPKTGQPTPSEHPRRGQVSVAVEKLIETEDGYILIGTFKPQVVEGEWVEVVRMPQISDAAGQHVPYDLVTDIELPVLEPGSLGRGEFSWAYKIKDAGLTYPLTLSFEGVYVAPLAGDAVVEFEFDVGDNPQAGQEWRLEREFQLSGHTLRLISVSCSGDGYSFVFSNANGVHSLSVEIVGHTPIGGGGGYGSQSFNADKIYQQLPTGKLTVRLSNLMVTSDPYTWTTAWQPETDHPSRGERPLAPTQTVGTCVDANTIAALENVPAQISGLLMIYDPKQQLVRVGDLRTLQTAFTLPNAANRAVFSPDGASIAYSDDTGMQIVSVDRNTPEGGTQDVISLPYAIGYNIAWSPDQSRLAYVAGGAGIYVVDNVAGSLPYRVSEIANEAIAGWSSDGAFLYVAQPDLTAGSWLLRKIDAQSGVAENIFLLPEASRKAPFAALSPDGNWLAYRDSDLNAVLLLDLQGNSENPRRLVDLSGSPDYTTIGSLVWSGDWLGINLLGSQDEFAVLLVDPATCQSYIIDGSEHPRRGVGGYLLGVVISAP